MTLGKRRVAGRVERGHGARTKWAGRGLTGKDEVPMVVGEDRGVWAESWDRSVVIWCRGHCAKGDEGTGRDLGKTPDHLLCS